MNIDQDGNGENAVDFETFEQNAMSDDDGEQGDASGGEADANPNVNDQDDAGEAAAGEAHAGEADAGEAAAGDEDDGKPKGKSAKDRIRELNTRARDAERRAIDLEARLEKIEKGGLTPSGEGDNEEVEAIAPDYKDTEKYPLGILDDRYQEDALNFKAEQAAARLIDGLLQRQEQSAEQEAAEQQLTTLRATAETLTVAGEEIHDDYRDVVLEAGLRGDYKLTQATFEAAVEAENGAQILYDLASDPAEAERVSKLSVASQVKYVLEKDGKLTTPAARKIPGAGAPPGETPKGRPTRQAISPSTTNFEDFERLANGRK